MAPISVSAFTTTVPSLLRRSLTCDLSTTSCSPHRTAVIILIIAMGFLTTSILLWYYLRKRATVHPGPTRFTPGLVHPHRVHRKRESTSWRRNEDEGLELPRYDPGSDAPPPYVNVLARPEDVHVHGART